MTLQGWLQIALLRGRAHRADARCSAPTWRASTAARRVLLSRVLGPVERTLYRLLRTDPERGQDWKGYARTVLVFSALFFVVLFVILRTQGVHPFNPEGYDSAPWDVSFNTAASFVSNTNWQFYGGETTLSVLLADDRPGGAELHLGGRRHGRRWSPSSAASPRARPRRSATSGSTSRARCSTSCCRSRCSARCSSSPRDAADAGRLRDLPDAHRRRADARARPRRLPGGHQGARHQRRRLLQRQLGDAVREPERR